MNDNERKTISVPYKWLPARWRSIFLFAGTLALALSVSGCAKLPPTSNTLSGKRLSIVMRFRSPVNANNHYFFLINNAGDQNAPGPVPVLLPPYGNGIATGTGGTAGFTDFIRYDNLQPQGYGLYHVVGDPNRSNFVLTGRPINATIPDSNDPRSANVLQFEIDLSQLITDSNGQPLADQAAAAAQAKALRYLQVNIVATDVIPRDLTTQVNKQVDSLGDNTTLAGSSAFLIVDLSQNRIVRNSDFTGQLIQEPSNPDVYGAISPDPTLDLVDWSVEVRQI